ncbi:DUF6011 domain-containing protein [Streptomyces sp. H39-S7]|uniref:DUF6011 domain-containing protein n=1 Tax=Streptomyces sp. H39-S7 TaxID=3004357 RepID=UPI0022AFCE24|nr:DUF6011 domain-containing protein [Streptomyces sp. H39-S7]MCZ4124723.1 DUF6011 domain-containing protein [Streptomyces sp. H39-S7]
MFSASDSDPATLPGFAAADETVAGRPRVLCRLCGRPLNDPESRLWGLGEGCRNKLDTRSAPRPAANDVEQERLPGT